MFCSGRVIGLESNLKEVIMIKISFSDGISLTEKCPFCHGRAFAVSVIKRGEIAVYKHLKCPACFTNAFVKAWFSYTDKLKHAKTDDEQKDITRFMANGFPRGAGESYFKLTGKGWRRISRRNWPKFDL